MEKVLEPHTLILLHNQNGNHIVQRMIEHNPEQTGFIINQLKCCIKEFSRHTYKSRVIMTL